MTEMKFGKTQIKVKAHKVEEMLRKGWKLIEAEEPQIEAIEDEDSEEE